MDFFTVRTVTGRLLFVFVVLSHDRRRVVHVNCTAHPTWAWTAQQLLEAFPEDIDGVHLIQQSRALGAQRPQRDVKIDRHHSAAGSFAAYAACFSLRAAFRVCHALCSVFGFAFSRFFDSRVAGVVVEAI